MPYELLTRYRVLPIGQTLEVLLPHFAGNTPFLCQSAMPFAAYPITLGVVVLLSVGEFFLVIGLRLSGAQRLGNGEHNSLVEVQSLPSSNAFRVFSQPLRIALLARRNCTWLRCTPFDFADPRCACSGYKSRLRLQWRQVWKAERHDQIVDLDQRMQAFEAADFRRKHERFRSPFSVTAPRSRTAREPPGINRLFRPLHFYFSNGVRDPFGRARLAGMQENLRRGLRQHCFGFMPIPHFQLATALESDYDRISGLAILCQGSMQLRQSLQACKLVKNEPCVADGGVALVH